MKKRLLLISLVLISLTTKAQWAVLNSGTTKNLSSTYFVSESTGCVVGNTGTLLRTTDGGTTWNSISSGTIQHLQSVFFPTNSVGYVVGNSGTILKTVDGGISWNALNSGTGENLLDVYFLTSDLGWAVGYNKTILHTTDGGQNWSSYDSNILNSYIWFSVYPIDNSTVMVGGSNQSFAITNNSGTDWTESRLGSVVGKMCCALVAINFVDNNLGFAVTNKSDVLKTVDGGNNWTALDTVTFAFQGLNSIDFVSASNGWMVGDDIFNTIDGGLNWNLQTNPSGNNLYDVFFSSNTVGYAVGTRGTILKTSNGGSAGIAENLAKGISLSIFPNPAAQNVHIEMQASEVSEIGISITDLSGKLIRQMNDASKSDGTFSYTLERGNIPGGIYFLTIQTETEKWVRKISFTN